MSLYFFYQKRKNWCDSILSSMWNRIFIDQKIHSIVCRSSFQEPDKSDENKDRVPFYMSMLTTMKFLVRGKSVDLKNREGSSPSIPKKPICPPTIYPFYPPFPCMSVLIHSPYSFWNRSGRKCLIISYI